jgi:hypothetical protein
MSASMQVNSDLSFSRVVVSGRKPNVHCKREFPALNEQIKAVVQPIIHKTALYLKQFPPLGAMRSVQKQ